MPGSCWIRCRILALTVNLGPEAGFSNLALRPLCQAFKVRVIHAATLGLSQHHLAARDSPRRAGTAPLPPRRATACAGRRKGDDRPATLN